MNHELSLRLQTCLDALHPLQTVADIGTDHGYLPCVGILKGKLKKAIAADVGQGPLESAKTTIERFKLDERIETRLGSGLSVLAPQEVEGVVIAGMGGKLITSILDADVLLTRSFQRLVLQPNIDADLVRNWLARQRFMITDEKIVCDEGKFYEVIVAQPVEQAIEYTDLDVTFGPVLRRHADVIFKERWLLALKKTESILAAIPEEHPRASDLRQRQQQLKEVLQ